MPRSFLIKKKDKGRHRISVERSFISKDSDKPSVDDSHSNDDSSGTKVNVEVSVKTESDYTIIERPSLPYKAEPIKPYERLDATSFSPSYPFLSLYKQSDKVFPKELYLDGQLPAPGRPATQPFIPPYPTSPLQPLALHLENSKYYYTHLYHIPKKKKKQEFIKL